MDDTNLLNTLNQQLKEEINHTLNRARGRVTAEKTSHLYAKVDGLEKAQILLFRLADQKGIEIDD